MLLPLLKSLKRCNLKQRKQLQVHIGVLITVTICGLCYCVVVAGGSSFRLTLDAESAITQSNHHLKDILNLT